MKGDEEQMTTDTGPTVVSLLRERLEEYKLRGIWLRNVRVSRAKENSANPGALYLKSQFGDYLGKITADGQLRTIVQLSPEIKSELREFVQRGKEYLAEVGKDTGICCYCGLELTDPDSVALGYGPICAGKHGLPHPNRHGF